MFSGCQNLQTTSALPATELADFCYVGMFGGCICLEKGPNLPAKELTLGCYHDMFVACHHLKEISVNFEE